MTTAGLNIAPVAAGWTGQRERPANRPNWSAHARALSSAFTLIELLVVISIIAVLASLLCESPCVGNGWWKHAPPASVCPMQAPLIP